MKQKIEWYKEVLELEPGSRVFFPLAKLLAADGQTPEAILTLQQGVLRHPEHIEAHLLLVELLFVQQQSKQVQAEIEKLGTLFATYPGFWEAWSNSLAATPAMQDASLAMRFFAAALQGQSISWGAIIEHGLQAMLSKKSEEATSQKAFTVKPTAQEETAMRKTVVHEAETSAELPTCVSDDSLENADDEQEEAFSLRTRSMAEVLAEQGDVAGALEILDELKEAASPEEKTSLETRSEELVLRLQGGASDTGEKSESKAASQGAESPRLTDLLGSLANRLEARAR